MKNTRHLNALPPVTQSSGLRLTCSTYALPMADSLPDTFSIEENWTQMNADRRRLSAKNQPESALISVPEIFVNQSSRSGQFAHCRKLTILVNGDENHSPGGACPRCAFCRQNGHRLARDARFIARTAIVWPAMRVLPPEQPSSGPRCAFCRQNNHRLARDARFAARTTIVWPAMCVLPPERPSSGRVMDSQPNVIG